MIVAERGKRDNKGSCVHLYAPRNLYQYLKKATWTAGLKGLSMWLKGSFLASLSCVIKKLSHSCVEGAGSCEKLIFAFGCLCWANTLLTFLCKLWLKIISSSNKLCWCIFAQPTPTLQHLHPSCHSPRTKRLLLHLLSSFTANFIQLDSLFYICICVK